MNTTRRKRTTKIEPMKVAILFSGRIKGYKSVKKNLLRLKDQYSPTFFCSLNKKTYSPYIKEFCENFSIQKEQINLELLTEPEWITDIQDLSIYVNPLNTWFMWYHLQKAFSLLTAYQATHNIKFDCILFYRADINSKVLLPLRMPVKNTIYIPDDNDFYDNGTNGIMAYGSYDTMLQYTNIVEYFKKLCKTSKIDSLHPELVLTKYLQNKHINVVRFPYKYILLKLRHMSVPEWNNPL